MAQEYLIQLLTAKGVPSADAAAIADALEKVMSEKGNDVVTGKCNPMEAYDAISASLAEYHLSPHDFVSYPDEETWEQGYIAVSTLIRNFQAEKNIPENAFWVVDDIYGERAHGIHVESFKFLTPELENQLQEMLQKGFPDWEVVVMSSQPGETCTIRIGANGVRRLNQP